MSSRSASAATQHAGVAVSARKGAKRASSRSCSGRQRRGGEAAPRAGLKPRKKSIQPPAASAPDESFEVSAAAGRRASARLQSGSPRARKVYIRCAKCGRGARSSCSSRSRAAASWHVDRRALAVLRAAQHRRAALGSNAELAALGPACTAPHPPYPPAAALCAAASPSPLPPLLQMDNLNEK